VRRKQRARNSFWLGAYFCSSERTARSDARVADDEDADEADVDGACEPGPGAVAAGSTRSGCESAEGS
jgi:hypothetical protein